MNIHPVNNAKGDSNTFCGPAAISIVTGMATGEAARLIRAVSNKTAVKGTHAWHLEKAFAKCGVAMKKVKIAPSRPATEPERVVRNGVAYIKAMKTKDIRPALPPTLTQWLKESKSIRTPGRVFLVGTTTHWQIITGRRFCCSNTKQIVSITDDKVQRRARIDCVYELTALPSGITTPDMARKPKAKIHPCRAALSKLERQHGFKGRVRNESSYIDFVVDPCSTFPRGLQTCHHGWGETLERVEAALEDYDSAVDEEGWLSL